ncbi:MAG: hypothetical protein N2383_07035 [Caldilineales bacterium]|nr:hypothetical protein [Caldilineales bacterium]
MNLRPLLVLLTVPAIVLAGFVVRPPTATSATLAEGPESLRILAPPTLRPSVTPTLTPDTTPTPLATTPTSSPTDTPVPPTNTPVPPKNTPVPPTNTAVPPTDTPIAPANTPVSTPTLPGTTPAATLPPAPTVTPAPVGGGTAPPETPAPTATPLLPPTTDAPPAETAVPPAGQDTTVSPPNPTAALTPEPAGAGTAVVFQPLVQDEEETATPVGRGVRPSLFLAIGAVALVLAGGLLVFIRRQF